MPTMDSNQRKAITSEFFKYRHATQKQLWDKYSAYEHWAKIEVRHFKTMSCEMLIFFLEEIVS